MSAVEPRMRDFDQWSGSLRNYEWLREVCPGATDIDLLIERGGRFLVFEGKRWTHGVHVSLGQHIALAQLALLDEFTVYLVGEMADDSTFPYRITPYGRWHPLARGAHVLFPPNIFDPATQDDLRQLVRDWMGKK